MLHIRKGQMELLKQNELRKFVERVMSHLRNDFTEDVKEMSDEQLREFVETGIKTSKKYDVVNERDIQLYLDCMVIINPEFDRDSKVPWAQKILNKKDIDGRAKMAQISEYLVFGWSS